MAERQMLKHKIHFKRQAIPLIKAEIQDHQIRLALIILKEKLESKTCEPFDQVLNQKIDCVNFLLEN